MDVWVKMAKVSDVPSGEAVVSEHEGLRVALFHVADSFYATQAHCPHAGALLSEGELNGVVVTCPLHAWRFDVTSGQGVDPEGACLKRYPLRVENGEVWVCFEPPTSNRDSRLRGNDRG